MSSVVLKGGRGVEIRVRRWPSDRLGQRVRVVSTPPPGQAEAADEAVQLTLDAGLPDKILPEPVLGDAKLYVLWWADRDESMLDGASLALVQNIDDAHHVRILAEAPLPEAKKRPTGTEAAPSTPDTLDDFEDFEDGTSGTGTSTSA